MLSGDAALFTATAIVTWGLTGLVRRYALRTDLIDRPNERSSHSRPTPRGGGISIVAAVLAYTLIATDTGMLDRRFGVALLCGGGTVAIVGWLDDRRRLGTLIRFISQLLAAMWTVYWLGGIDSLILGTATIRLSFAGPPLTVLFIVWLTNLYNFMDGIDGIAGLNAFSVGLIATLLLRRSGDNAIHLLTLVLAAASLGFLFWNWAPARIFMGDVGSGFLGFTFATIAVASEKTRALPALVWIALLGVFLVDATTTLLRRVSRKEQWYSAHRSHAYQRAVSAGASHARVSASVGLVNCLLGLVALLMIAHPEVSLFLLAIAVAGLIGLYLLVEKRNPM